MKNVLKERSTSIRVILFALFLAFLIAGFYLGALQNGPWTEVPQPKAQLD